MGAICSIESGAMFAGGLIDWGMGGAKPRAASGAAGGADEDEKVDARSLGGSARMERSSAKQSGDICSAFTIRSNDESATQQFGDSNNAHNHNDSEKKTESSTSPSPSKTIKAP